MRIVIAVFEHINAVVAETRDPDIPFRVCGHSLRPNRAALVSIRRRHWHAGSRETRHASVSRRWGWNAAWSAAAAHPPAEVAEPHRAGGIDCDAITGAENAATQQRRQRRSVPAIGRLAIGFEYQIEISGVSCALERVVRNPSVSSSVKRDVSGAA